MAGMVRALGGHMTDENQYKNDMAKLGEDLFDAPSVFNYYAPDYSVPNTSVMGGEFEIHTPNSSIVRANLVGNLILRSETNPVQTASPGTNVDLSPFVPLASNPPALVNALDLTFTHGVMPAVMKTIIINGVRADGGNSLHKVQTGCYLILTSSYYNVWH